MKTKLSMIIAVWIGLAVLLIGCGNDGKQLKQDALNAIEKNKTIENNSFSGSADLKLPSSVFTGDSLASAVLMNQLGNGSFSWTGTASRNPVRLEVKLGIGQIGDAAAIELPILLKDNKMYFQIPGINGQDEFFAIDMSKLSQASKKSNPLKPEMLKNVGDATTNILKTIIDAVDPKWFSKAKAEDGDQEKEERIVIEINQDNIGNIALMLFQKFPSAVDELQKNGLITPDRANHYKKLADDQALEHLKSTLDGLTIQQPGQVSLTIDEQGYIVKYRIDLELVIQSENTRQYHIHLNSKLGQINQEPAFKLPIPQNTRSFDEVLNLFNNMK